jgi:SPP1 family predicted phage head-tail adaptor
MQRPIRIGEFLERITIQSAAITRDAYGAELLTWLDGATVWAKVVAKSGREPILADRPIMIVGYEITIRTNTSITQRHRLVWRGKTLTIDAIFPIPAAGLLTLACTEAQILVSIDTATPA